jgi:glycosyltransferase involved in cell wall biosynthesis
MRIVGDAGANLTPKESVDVAPSRTGKRLKLAVVLWNGGVGGAETLSVSLAERLRRLGADVTIVLVEQPGPLAERLASAGIPHRSLGFKHGRGVLRHPRRYTAGVARSGQDGALLVERGFMGAALRVGGYRAPIVAVEHGALIGLERFSKARQLLWRIDYASGAWADDIEVAVSDFMLGQMHRHSHAPRTQRIYNGIDPERFLPAMVQSSEHRTGIVVGFAGRLIPGKGADHLIRAVARAGEQVSVTLLIAGDGSERAHLESLAQSLGAESRVRFLGTIDDPQVFWHECDVAAIPSDAFIESFSMVTLETMMCGKAIVASRNGAIPELMVDTVTGTLVAPGDVNALAQALVSYARQPALRLAHGAAARKRAVEHFHIDACAQAYLDVFSELTTSKPWRPWRWPDGTRRPRIFQHAAAGAS